MTSKMRMIPKIKMTSIMKTTLKLEKTSTQAYTTLVVFVF